MKQGEGGTMHEFFTLSSLVAIASPMVAFDAVAADTNEVRPGDPNQAVAADIGEIRAIDCHQRQGQCATVPRFADRVTPIGPGSGNPGRDTFAHPVTSVDIVCATSPTR